MKKLFFIVLITFMFFTIHNISAETLAERPSNFHDVDAGSENNPFLIANLANLRWLSETPSVWGSNTGFKLQK